MSLVNEFPYIENAFNNLGLDEIPVYIVRISKTESEDFVLSLDRFPFPVKIEIECPTFLGK
jgi:hypothetical protein